ncbi:MAG TPA: NAD-dependent epimerase/dehydratase family protein [Stellaceae bacterium]|nr:NAD-dependent epimerase/dehydratase family protein [Stellaceae bacterium]
MTAESQGAAPPDAFSGARALVTGGLGFIGSTLAGRLVALGAEVTILDDMFPEGGANPANIAAFRDRVRVEIADLRDTRAVAPLIEGQDYLFSLGARTSHMGSLADPLADLDVNCRAQLDILEICRARAPRIAIVFAGTRQIYGRPDKLPVEETHPLRPPDPNGVSKMAGEAYHLLYHRIHGISAVSLRLTNTYGPRMRIKDGRQTFLGLWVRRLLEDAPFEVWGGEQRRDLAFVDDVAEAFLLAAVSPDAQGRAFNIGGDPSLTLLELARILVAASGGGRYEIKEFPPERLKIDIGDYEADDGLFRRMTGWRPRVALADGLARTMRFYRDHRGDYF